jgi:hypothetical protein
MENTIYSYEGNWLLVNGQRVLQVPDGSPEIMELKVKEYQKQADKAKQRQCLGSCCSNH